MGVPPFLTEFLLLLITATMVAVVLERFRLPSILGFLLAGVMIGPHGFGLLHNEDTIHLMAELGVVLLMLTIGLEFSFFRLKGLGKLAGIGGGLQMILSMLIGLLFGGLMGWGYYQGLFAGSVIALSSTAIVLKHLMDRGELDTQQGRIALSILLFQDLAVVPLMIFVTGTGDGSGLILQNLGISILKTGILIGFVFAFARFFLPHFLRMLALMKNREIFFLASVVICLGTAWLSGVLGLSLAIGAFFAGIMFANTDYRGQLMGDISSFRHVFVSIFFVSIGMLFNVEFALTHVTTVLAMFGLVLLVNFVIMTGIIMGFGYSPRVAIAAGLILSQIGEFSFLLLEAGREQGTLDSYFYQLFLSTAFLTMFMTPFLFALVPLLLRMTERIGFLGRAPEGVDGNALEKMSNHIILCGLGPSGQDLAHTFREEKLPFIVLEMNPSSIQTARKQGMTVIYGDAANREVLHLAGINRARAVIVSFSDNIGMAQIVRVVEEMNADLLLVVRTRFQRDVAELYQLGADIVVMEEVEASRELNRVLLEHFQTPEERVVQHLDRIRMRKELLIEEAIMKSMQKGKK